MFKPLLAPREDPLSYSTYFDKLRYPLMVSPKLDGIRCIVRSGVAYSRTWKPLPSVQVQEEFTGIDHLDGELIIGECTDTDVYNRTQSHIMSFDKPGDVRFHVFDFVHPEHLYTEFVNRYQTAEFILKSKRPENYYMVPHQMVRDHDELLKVESEYLQQGYEGVMMRNPEAYYKQGRATINENIIYKLKRFCDDEAVIVDFKEQMINTNTQERDELGYAKRSSSMAGLVPSGLVGGFVCWYDGQEIEVAPGSFNHEQRADIWRNRDHYMGSTLKFRYFKHGIKEKPRFPRATGFRTKEDM
jgi:DNA ligase 1